MSAKRLTKKFLTQCYRTDQLTAQEISRKAGCDTSDVRRALREYGIKRKKKPLFKEVITRDHLADLYTNQGIGHATIAKLYGFSASTVRIWVRRWGITSCETPVKKTLNFKIEIPKSILKRMHVNCGLSIKQISFIFGCDSSTILKRFKEHELSHRKDLDNRLPEEFLESGRDAMWVAKLESKKSPTRKTKNHKTFDIDAKDICQFLLRPIAA